jgi:hypothetical protein
VTNKEIVYIVKSYDKNLTALGIKPKRINTNKSFGFYKNSPCRLLQHAKYLCGIFESHTDTGKINRHLTAIQMVLSFAGVYTLDELMHHNKYNQIGGFRLNIKIKTTMFFNNFLTH